MSNRIIVGDIHFRTQEMFDAIQKDFFTWLVDTYGDQDYILDFEGDLFDTRKATNNFILKKVVELFDHLETKFTEINICVGNHDVIASHSSDNTNILEKIFRHNKKINVFSRVALKGNVIYFPYDFKDTDEFKEIEKLKGKKNYILIGHFEHSDLYRDSKYALDDGFFKQFKYAFGGHWHQPWKKGNFCYTGTPFELCQNPKGSEFDRGVYLVNDEDFNPKFVLYPGYKHFYTFTVKSDEDVHRVNELTKSIKDKNIKVLVERNYKAQAKKIIETCFKGIEKDNHIKIETYESESLAELESEILKDVSIFTSEELQKTIRKFVDIKYTQPDKPEMHRFLNEILTSYQAS